jgi:hypothetical protein
MGTAALMSATFHEPGYEHLVELVHQRDRGAARRLTSLDVVVYDADGTPVAHVPVDARQEILDLDAALAGIGVPGGGHSRGRFMVVLDARYDASVFPYRPHHYGYLHRPGSVQPSLYYAMSSALGGVPDRIEASARTNNFETYLFPRRAVPMHASLMIGNVSRFAAAEVHVVTYHGSQRRAEMVTLAPKAHRDIPLASEIDGQALRQVEVKGLFRLATYVVARERTTGDLMLFDHLFTYFR